MTCIHCRGEMKRGTTPCHVDRTGCHLILHQVPAWICGQCGEACFAEREIDAIQALAESVQQKAEALTLSA